MFVPNPSQDLVVQWFLLVSLLCFCIFEVCQRRHSCFHVWYRYQPVYLPIFYFNCFDENNFMCEWLLYRSRAGLWPFGASRLRKLWTPQTEPPSNLSAPFLNIFYSWYILGIFTFLEVNYFRTPSLRGPSPQPMQAYRIILAFTEAMIN